MFSAVLGGRRRMNVPSRMADALAGRRLDRDEACTPGPGFFLLLWLWASTGPRCHCRKSRSSALRQRVEAAKFLDNTDRRPIHRSEGSTHFKSVAVSARVLRNLLSVVPRTLLRTDQEQDGHRVYFFHLIAMLSKRIESHRYRSPHFCSAVFAA